MRSRFSTLLLAVVCASLTHSNRAAVPPPEQLLPADTIALFTVPDWDKTYAAYQKSPQSKLLDEPALKPFKEKVVAKFKDSLVAPFERELGIKLTDYTDLLHGQLTIAFTRNGWDGKSDNSPAFLLLLDSKNKKDALAKQLADLKKKWVDAGKDTKSESLHGVPFTTLIVKKADIDSTLQKVLPSRKSKDKPEDEQPKTGTFEVSVGQSDSLLIVGTSTKEIEKILVHQTGGQLPALAEEAAYAGNHAAMFRQANSFAWVNFAPIYETLSRKMSEAAPANPDNPLGFSMDKVLQAVGLSSLKTIGFSFGMADEGSTAEFALGLPEASRTGVFKILSPEAKDAAPPPFIPSDVTKFNRWRIDGKKAWASIESMVQAISPSLAGNLQMALGLIGKDKDPDFDLKKTFIGNLGDDFISYQKAPRAATLADLNSPPSLFLIGSGNPEKLGDGLKAGIAMLPMVKPGAALLDRDFLGRKIYSMPLRGAPATDTISRPADEKTFSFAASGGYLAMTTDITLLEEFLRSNESHARSLRESAGINDAAQKTGGMNNGMFGYENQQITTRAAFETLKKDKGNFDKVIAMALSLPQIPGAPSAGADWFDPSLLPPFDAIAKYFSFVVYSGAARNDGLFWKFYSPTPPNLH